MVCKAKKSFPSDGTFHPVKSVENFFVACYYCKFYNNFCCNFYNFYWGDLTKYIDLWSFSRYNRFKSVSSPLKALKRESYANAQLQHLMLFFLLLCYNSFKEIKFSDMDYVSAIIEAFWQYHIAFAGGLAAIVAIRIVYKIISSRLR